MQHYDKRKQRKHSSIGCEHENFLLAVGSFSSYEATLETLFLCSYILFHMFRNKTIFYFSRTLLLLQSLHLPPRVSTVTGVDFTWKSNNITDILLLKEFKSILCLT